MLLPLFLSPFTRFCSMQFLLLVTLCVFRDMTIIIPFSLLHLISAEYYHFPPPFHRSRQLQNLHKNLHIPLRCTKSRRLITLGISDHHIHYDLLRLNHRKPLLEAIFLITEQAKTELRQIGQLRHRISNPRLPSTGMMRTSISVTSTKRPARIMRSISSISADVPSASISTVPSPQLRTKPVTRAR